MADAYTGTSAMGNLVQAAYDRYVEFALRSQPQFRALADKRPVQQAMPGSSVVFSLYQDMSQATSALTETTDPDAVAIGNATQVTVTLAEYGNTVLNTEGFWRSSAKCTMHDVGWARDQATSRGS